jgi:hypothetical protein
MLVAESAKRWKKKKVVDDITAVVVFLNMHAGHATAPS